MKFKHNKKRNTALLYECLIKELTKSILQENIEKKDRIISIIKEFFNKNSVLAKELRVYKSISESSNLEKDVAEKVLGESKAQYQSISKKVVFEQQSSLIKEINKNVTKNVFGNFVPHYKDLATIYQWFNSDVSPRQKVLLEQNIIEFMTSSKETRKLGLPEYDGLVYKKFTENFNNVYSEKLLSEQKELLNKYITSFNKNALELKIYVNEEVGRIKKSLTEFTKTTEYSENNQIKNKFDSVYKMVESLKDESLDAKTIEKVLKLQLLVSEI